MPERAVRTKLIAVWICFKKNQKRTVKRTVKKTVKKTVLKTGWKDFQIYREIGKKNQKLACFFNEYCGDKKLWKTQTKKSETET